MRVMKIVGKEMKRKGVTMKRFYDNFPLCCPARTTILTGQYAHNHNVLSNIAARTAATASSTSCTATTTCPCGCRRPAIRPPTSASS